MASLDPFLALVEDIVNTYEKANDGAMPDSDWVAAVLLKKHRKEVDAWVASKLPEIVRNYAVTKKLGAIRSRTINQVRKTMASGTLDVSSPSILHTPYYVPNVGWKRVGAMTGYDHIQVSDAYDKVSTTLSRRSRLHAELAEEVGELTTEEVFNSEELIARLAPAYAEKEMTPVPELEA